MRNKTVDIIRGLAMLCVVLQHTMAGCVTNYSDSFLFQALWTLQMPLFVIISGYVTRYSRPITNSIVFWGFVKKRTIAYLLPWLVWTIVVRGLVFGQTEFLNFKHLLWHMDSGYWFLITIWTISMIYGFADLLGNKCFKNNPTINVLSHFALCGVGMAGLAFVGYLVGFGFFAVKLTLFYLPIYLIGYLYGKIQDWLLAKVNAMTIVNIVIIVSFGFWLAAINRFDFFAGSDNIAMVVGRFVTSVLGCVAVTGMVSSVCNAIGCWKCFSWAGIHSLEIYLTHYLFLSIAPAMGRPTLSSMEGMLSLVLNFLLTMVLVTITIKLVQGNNILNYLLYAKKENKGF